MNKPVMELVLPRLSQRMNRHLKRYQAGKLDDSEFNSKFETLLNQQFSWLAEQGIPLGEAAIAVHSAVIVISKAGLVAEAEAEKLPFEIVEFRAVKGAAEDIATNYGVSERKALRGVSALVAQYGKSKQGE